MNRKSMDRRSMDGVWMDGVSMDRAWMDRAWMDRVVPVSTIGGGPARRRNVRHPLVPGADRRVRLVQL